MKHVPINFHFILDQVYTIALRVTHVSFKDQLVDALTKPFPHTFFFLETKLNSLTRAPFCMAYWKGNVISVYHLISSFYVFSFLKMVYNLL